MRAVALTMPVVTVFAEPSGVPIVSTGSPVRTRDESPSRTVGSFVASICNTATSLESSTASTRALNSRRSIRRTVASLACPTTYAVVRMIPSAPTIKPDPAPAIARGPFSGDSAGCVAADLK